MGLYAHAQTNLLLNGDFESFLKCPVSATDTHQLSYFCTGWNRANLGQTRYFNACAPLTSEVSVPVNFTGTQLPHSGNAYMGFTAFVNPAYTSGAGFPRDYLQSKLKEPLKAGRMYYVEMYVSRADSNLMGYAVSNIGAYFSKTPVTKNDSFQLMLNPQVESSTIITDKVNWIKISGSFMATGGENYVTIGRFGSDQSFQILNIDGSLSKKAFYLIDDVKVIDSCTFIDAAAENILGPDSLFCLYAPFSKSINATHPSSTHYLWENGFTFPVRPITDTGTYWLKMMNGNCFAYDTVTFSSNKKPPVNLGKDTAICYNTPVRLQPKQKKNHYTYQWFIQAPNANFLVGTNSFYDINSPDKIILEVNDAGCKNYDTISVFKSSMKRAQLSNDTSFCRQNSLKLDVSATGAANFLWNTGSVQPVLYTTDLETYWVTVNDGLCYSTDTIHIQLLGAVKPTADTIVCENTVLTLSADPLSSIIDWSTGEHTVQISPTISGLYTLTQTNNTCVTKDTIDVTIELVPKTSLGDDLSVCVSPFYLLSAYSPYATQYKWSTGDTTSFLQISSNGNYAVQISNHTCTYSDTVSIRLQINTPFSFGNDKYDCFESGIVLSTSITKVDSFAWSTQSKDSFIVVDKPGKYWLKTSFGICTNYDTIEFFAKPRPTVDLPKDTIVCKFASMILDAQNPGCDYTWSNGVNSQTLLVDKPGQYFVLVTNADGCTAKDSIIFANYPVPHVFSTPTLSLCEDSSVTIIPNQHLASYNWPDGNIAKQFTTTLPGKIFINGLDTFGCAYKDSILVQLKNKPEILIAPTIATCELNIPLETEATYTTYLWQDSVTTPLYMITSFDRVKLTVTDANHCSNTTYIEVINNCPSEVTIPNVFSPNKDGVNDDIIPDYLNVKETEWIVFNRWGNIVFKTNNLQESWDGKVLHRSDAEDGTYYYTLVCKGSKDEKIERKGTITLLH